MRNDRPSITASWLAACRALGSLLPDDVRLAHDAYGARFCGRAGEALLAVAGRAPPLARVLILAARPWVAYVQARTRAIDDVLLGYLAEGGRQVVILGAGFDCRAARFVDALAAARVFEVDHAATQARKRVAMAGERQGAIAYLPWDFEGRPVSELPDALAALGLDLAGRTLVVWEGVAMYLRADAVEETLAAVHRLGVPGSTVAFTYFEHRRVTRPAMAAVRAAAGVFARAAGEPFRSGFDPAALAAWLLPRGFALERDRGEAELAAMLPRVWRGRTRLGEHVAVARTVERSATRPARAGKGGSP
ncbi:MAG: class I SAM-dependent methyltransferase [Anaeromyxobacteraceae bacterium]